MTPNSILRNTRAYGPVANVFCVKIEVIDLLWFGWAVFDLVIRPVHGLLSNLPEASWARISYCCFTMTMVEFDISKYRRKIMSATLMTLLKISPSRWASVVLQDAETSGHFRSVRKTVL